MYVRCAPVSRWAGEKYFNSTDDIYTNKTIAREPVEELFMDMTWAGRCVALRDTKFFLAE